MVNARPFDLGKLDFETIRLKKRKRLLLWSSPVVVILLLVSAWLIAPSLLTIDAANQFKTGQYVISANDVSSLDTMNLLETYKAYYNQGTALSAKGDQEQAILKFESALAYSANRQTSCMITYNLVLTMEGAGDTTLKKADFTGAINQYTKTLNRLQANKDCFPNDTLQKRIEAKIQAVEAARKSQGSKSGSSNQTQQPDQQPSQDQQQKIKVNEAKAAGQRHDDQTINTSTNYNDLPAGVKPW